MTTSPSDPWTILNTRVGRRVFLLFVLSALIPATGLAVVSYRSVNRHIREPTESRMRENAKAAGMALIERLMSADVQLSDAAASRPHWTPDHPPIRTRFLENVRLVRGWRATDPAGDGPLRLMAGEPLLTFEPGLDGRTRLRLSRLTSAGTLASGFVISDSVLAAPRIYADSRFGAGLCVYTSEGRIVGCDPVLERSWQVFGGAAALDGRGAFQWTTAGRSYLGAFWTAFLAPLFGSAPLHVALAETSDGLFVPIRTFRTAFLLAVALCFTAVIVFSTLLIRRTLNPLKELRAAVQVVGDAESTSWVDIRSGDEFEDLGTAFNAMTERIRTQLSFITSMRELDRAVLSSLEVREVASGALRSITKAFGTKAASFFLPNEPGDEEGTVFRLNAVDGPVLTSREVVRADDMRALKLSGADGIVVSPRGEGFRLAMTTTSRP